MKNKNLFQNDVISKTEKDIQKSETSIFQKTWVLTLIVLIAFISDFITLYTVIDIKLTQKVILSILITGVISGVMNISPVIFAKLMQDKKDKTVMKKTLIISLLTTFILFFVITFALRWTTRAQMFETQDDIVFETNDHSNDEYETDLGDDILAILLGFEPLGTSILVFSLSYKDPQYDKLKALKKARKQLINSKNEYEVKYKEIEREIQNVDLYQYDDQQYQVACHTVDEVFRQYLMKHFRRRLCERIKSPEAVTYLMEENQLKEKLDLGEEK